MLNSQKRRTDRALLLMAVLPAIFIVFSVIAYGVDTPLWDEWEIGGYLEKFAAGTLSFHDLFQQHNEYRQFFPNIIFVALGWLTRWDVRYWMAVSFLLACLVSFNVYYLGKRSLGDTRRSGWAFLAANLIIFSPVQYENWLQGQQLIYFLPVACLTSSLMVATSRRLRITSRFVLCAVLSLISSFSSANGLLCWIVLLPVLAWSSSWNDLMRKKFLIAGWVAGFVVAAVLYFWGYRSPTQHDPFAWMVANPFAIARYFLAILGGPLTFGRFAPAVAVGFVLIGLFCWCCVLFWKAKQDSPSQAQLRLCWLMLGAYSMLTAALVTIGRVADAVGGVPATRYTTYAVSLSVALVYLLASVPGKDSQKAKLGFSTARVLTIMLVASLAIHLPIYLLGIRYMSNFHVASIHSKACSLFLNVVDDECLTLRVYPRIGKLKRNINAVNRLGLIRPGLISSNLIQEIDSTSQYPRNRGVFERLVQVDVDQYEASGWANQPERAEPADSVLLAHEENGGPAIIFAIVPLDSPRDAVSALIGRGIYRDPHWSKRFSLAGINLGETKITAWGFDANSGKAYKLDGEHVLPKQIGSKPN